jgi:PAS domain-containing protein
MELPAAFSGEPTPPQALSLAGDFVVDGLLDALPIGVWVLDKQQLIRRVNQQAARWCAVRPEVLLGQSLAEASLPPVLKAAMLQLLEPGEMTPREVWLPEQQQWLSLAVSRQADGWVLHGQNSTLQKQCAQQHQVLADNIPDVLTRWGTDLRLHYANAAFATKIGQPLSALLGRAFDEMGVAADVTDSYTAALRRVFATGQPQEHHHLLRTPHGTESCYSRLVPEWHDGRVATVLGIAHSITPLAQGQSETLRHHGELAQRATDRYHSLFYAMAQGFCMLEIIFDDAGQRAIDFRYQELNPVFAEQSGMPADALGKTARELLPDLEPFWFDTYGEIVRTGVSVRIEHQVPQLGRWFDVHAFRVGTAAARQVAVLFTDITARKQAAEQLRLAATADSFRLQLADALGPLTSSVDIQAMAAQVLGQHLDVDRAYYVDINEATQEFVVAHGWHRPGAPSHARRYPISEWSMPWLLSGTTWVCQDVDTDPTLPDEQRAYYRGNAIRAAVVVPLLKQQHLVAILVANQNTPRAWTPQQVALVEEVAERTWATVERAKAEEALHTRDERSRADLEGQVQQRTAELQQSRDLLQATMDSTLDMIQVFEAVRDEAGQLVDFRWLLNNRTSESQYGEVRGQSLLERNPGVLQEGIFADFKRVVETGEPQQAERYYAHEQFDGWFLQSMVKLGDGVATSTKEITEWKTAHAEVLRLRLSQQQALFEAVQAAREAERRRIAEGLHNGIGQLLYATKLHLDQFSPLPATTPPAWQRAHHSAKQLLGEAIRQVRVLSHELVPLVLEEFGLASALQDICRNMSSPQLRLRAKYSLMLIQPSSRRPCSSLSTAWPRSWPKISLSTPKVPPRQAWNSKPYRGGCCCEPKTTAQGLLLLFPPLLALGCAASATKWPCWMGS